MDKDKLQYTSLKSNLISIRSAICCKDILLNHVTFSCQSAQLAKLIKGFHLKV